MAATAIKSYAGVAARAVTVIHVRSAMPFALTEDELRKTESELGAVLPASYRESMKQSNGGAVEVGGDTWELFPIRDQSNRKLLSRTANHVLCETQSAQK
jgi:SMI1 / KNR4 family (SUKH-1)